MRQFQVGDLVTAVKTHGYLKEGKKYRVQKLLDRTNIDYLVIILDDNNIERDYFEFRFVKYVNKKNHLPVWF